MRTALLLLATAAFASATTTRCANNNLQDLISKTSCGCPRKLSKCLDAVADFMRLDQVEPCFTESGCGKAEAAEGAIRFSSSYTCDESKDLEGQDELRRRADATTENTKDDDAKTTAEDETTAAPETSSEDAATSSEDAATSTDNADETTTDAAETTVTPETTAPTTADATTTADAQTTTAVASTTASTPESTTSAATAATAQSQTAGTTTTPLQCSVTSMLTTSACQISKGKKVSCTPTVIPKATCAPGVICQKDSKGGDICMKIDNHLTTSGVAVTIIFGVGILGAIGAIIFSHYQSRAANRKLEVERTMLLGAAYAQKGNGRGRAADVENTSTYQQRNPSEAHVPLISPGGTRSDQPYQHPYSSADYFNAPAAGESNSVSPNEGGRGGAPKLHPGLGALGQDYR